MALPTLHSFEVPRGDTRQLTYVVKDQDGVVVNITGALIEWALSPQDTSSTLSEPQPLGGALVEKDTTGGGVVITDAVNGAFRVEVDSDDTVGLTSPGDYYHEIQMTLATVVTTLAYGVITLKRDRIAPGP